MIALDSYYVMLGVLGFAVIFQLLAVTLALRLIPISHGWISWTLIAIAMALRTARTMITFMTVLQAHNVHLLNAVEHWFTLAVSVTLAIGLWTIRPLFLAFQAALASVEQANRDLQRRTEELETANREMETFSYSVAHDLRSPLRSIAGFGDYLLAHYADQLDARGQDYLRRMRSAAQRMGQLIDDLLHLARIGRVPLQRESVDLGEIAADIIAGLRHRYPERQVTVKIAPGMTVVGDAILLRLALENLLDNAWKFTSKRDDAQIDVGIEIHGGRRVVFVHDNGAGFNMAYAEKLFLPFHRLHTDEEFPGIGIGLPLAQRIIERHGGHIWAESAEGQGATFYFTLGENI